MLIRMKKLLELEDTDIPEDEILEHYLELAKQMAYSFCNTDTLPECYNHIIVELAIHLFLNKDTLNLKSRQEGERVSTYYNAEDGIPDYIKRALPLPRVRVI